MNKYVAKARARRYSKQYATFWFVREVSPGQFEPYAHSSEDKQTVVTFYCGEERKD